MKNAICLGKFHGFHFNEVVHFELLQFVDDTILICYDSWINIWSIKAMLRGFELASDLCISLYKNKTYSINLNNGVLQSTISLLSFGIGTSPFKFLGIMVGANPRLKEKWTCIWKSSGKGCQHVTGSICQ